MRECLVYFPVGEEVRHLASRSLTSCCIVPTVNLLSTGLTGVLLGVVLASGTAQAQPFRPSALPRSPEERLQRREEVRTQVQERHTDARKRIQAHVKERITAHVRRVILRLQAAIERLTRLANRIEQRLNALASEGENVADKMTLLASARAEIQQAQTSLNAVAAALMEVTAGEQPRQAFQQARESVRGVVTHLKNAHGMLVRVVTMIQGLRVGTFVSPSPSPVTPASPSPTP